MAIYKVTMSDEVNGKEFTFTMKYDAPSAKRASDLAWDEFGSATMRIISTEWEEMGNMN